jgi:transposase
MLLFARTPQAEERAELERLARSSETVTHRHARVVLLSLAGKKVPEIQEALGLSDRTVRDTLHRFNAHGAAALVRRKAPGKVPLLDAAAQAALLELVHRPPSDFGIESRLWTAAELARVATEQGLVPQISRYTVARVVAKWERSWKRAKRWTNCPDPQYTAKRGRSSA